jgi:hypothetical protein
LKPPFDLPPDSIAEALRADLCRPAVAEELKVSKPGDHDADHQHHEHVEEVTEPAPAIEEPPVRGWMPQPWRRPQPIVGGSMIYPVPPLDGRDSPDGQEVGAAWRPRQAEDHVAGRREDRGGMG